MSNLTVSRLRETAQDYVAAEPGRSNTQGWWRKTLLATARVDARFDRLKEMVAADHLSPNDLLTGARTVIVFFIPFQKKLVRENRAGDRPTREWGLSYVETNDLIERLAGAIGALLKGGGYRFGLTPATHNFDETRLISRWSHKHLAYLAGMGRFGVHNLLITPAGCAGRLGSLVTDADIGDHPLTTSAHACLVKAGRECGKCIEVCPVGALSEGGFDRRGCWGRLNDNRDHLGYFSDLPETTHVCGKCAALMPCSFINPVRKAQQEE
jgi:epoxyqueuosine reductase QueG